MQFPQWVNPKWKQTNNLLLLTKAISKTHMQIAHLLSEHTRNWIFAVLPSGVDSVCIYFRQDSRDRWLNNNLISASFSLTLGENSECNRSMRASVCAQIVIWSHVFVACFVSSRIVQQLNECKTNTNVGRLLFGDVTATKFNSPAHDDEPQNSSRFVSVTAAHCYLFV